ncbi:MAG: carbohydrate kinase family protein [Candidatus Thorarchaeota archaeon]
MYDIVVIGNPSFLLTNDILALSGPGVYSAAAAAKLGVDQLAIVGSIDLSKTDQFATMLDALSVPEYYLIENDGAKGHRIEYPLENNQTVEFLGFTQRIGIRDIPDEFLQARVILLCPSLQEIDSELIAWICDSSDSHVFLNPQIRTVSTDGRLKILTEFNLMEKTHCFLDVIQPNEQDSLLITGESDPYLAAELLVEWAAETCIITRGDRGSLIYDGNDFHIIPPFKTNSIDELFAGSVYLAGFAFQHLAGKTLPECGAFGSSLASVKIEKKGLDFEINTSEIKQRYEKISDSIEVR